MLSLISLKATSDKLFKTLFKALSTLNLSSHSSKVSPTTNSLSIKTSSLTKSVSYSDVGPKFTIVVDLENWGLAEIVGGMLVKLVGASILREVLGTSRDISGLIDAKYGFG